MSDDHAFLPKQIAEGAFAFRLYGLGPNGDRRNPIDRWSATLGLATIRDEVEARAQRYVDSMGGNQAFQLSSVDENDRELACEVFRLQAMGVAGPAGLMTEPANEGGMTQQAMRHAEAYARMLLQMTAQQDKTQTRMVDRLLARNDEIEARLLGGIELMGKLARDENAQAIELYKAKTSGEAKLMLGRKLGDLIPLAADAVASKYGGKTVSDVTLINATREIFSGLTGQQMDTIMGAMTDTQRMQIMHVMKRIAAQDEAAQQKDNAAMTAATGANASEGAAEVKH